MAVEPESVLSFWFPPGLDADLETHQAHMRRWFQGTREFDCEIRERFETLHAQACHGELQSWENLPQGRLALIIVLDQFSRNLYRDDGRAFAQDDVAQRLAQGGIDAGMLDGFRVWEQLFFCLPFSHSEDLAMQESAVQLAKGLPLHAPEVLKPCYEYALTKAEAMRDVVARFGRNPERNQRLGRESTPEETAYLSGILAPSAPK